MRHSSILILALGTRDGVRCRSSQRHLRDRAIAGLARHRDVDSVRGDGRGGAAMFWGEPDPWVNPASLSTVHGIGWVAGRTKVAPDFSDGLVFDSQRLLVGTAGVGLSFMGQPISGLGRARLDTGPITIYDPFGTTEFSLIDETQGWGFGLSPLRVIDALRRAHGSSAPPLTDVGEVSFGFQAKRTHLTIEPDGQRFDAGRDTGLGRNGPACRESLVGPGGAVPARRRGSVLGAEPLATGDAGGRRRADALRPRWIVDRVRDRDTLGA
jgi:hypothetical protein